MESSAGRVTGMIVGEEACIKPLFFWRFIRGALWMNSSLAGADTVLGEHPPLQEWNFSLNNQPGGGTLGVAPVFSLSMGCSNVVNGY